MAKKILLVDDARSTLWMAQRILEQGTPYQIVTAKDGVDAMASAMREAPDLLLMDVVMPRMNGFEVCRRLRLEESTRRVPIILLTTRVEMQYLEAGYQSGCNDYLNKPVKGEELIALLHSYLGE